MSQAWDAGVRTARIQINWQDVERTPGNYSWSYVDGLVDPLVQRGFDVHAILTLPPSFRRANGDGLMPANINRPWNAADNYWADWVGEAAAHFRGRIDSYEVWNEPDLDQYWNGTPGQYFQLLRVSYQAIKANDPNALVVMAGMAIFVEPDFFPEVMRTLATHPASPANDYYFDVLSIHAYTHPATVYDTLLDARGLLDRYGLGDKPIWLTETGVPLCCQSSAPSTPTFGYGDEQEAGWFVLQGVASALAAGVERIYFYRFYDTDDPVFYGMLRGDYSPRPAFDAFRVAADYLSIEHDSDVTRRVSGGATIVSIDQPNGRKVTIVWANDGSATQAAVPANYGSGVLVDWTGQTGSIRAENGLYPVPLQPSTNPLIGGPAVLILEEDFFPPFVQVTRLPDSTAANTKLPLRWFADDGEFGSGVAGFDVQVRYDGGEWFTWLTNTLRTEAIYDISAGGNFQFRVRAHDGAGNVSDFLTFNPNGTQAPPAPPAFDLGANFTSLPPVEGGGDLFFGANFVPPDQPWVDLAWDAGVRSTRIQLNWQDVERSPGARDWSYADSFVRPLDAYGYEITAILTLPPEFRRANPLDGLMPADLYLLWNDPDNAWAAWVHDVAQRYEGQIDAYEIWNEPDLDQYWDGTAADYAELLRSAYQAIKNADPDVNVVMGGLALREDLAFMSDTLDYIVADEQGPLNDHFFDVAAIHVYSETNLIYDELVAARQLLDSHGLTDKPIWLTETNVPIWGEANGPQEWESGYANPEEASWFIVQALATARAGGAERLMVYRLHDVGEPIAYGLLRNDQSERPSYAAYQTAVTFMSGIRSAEREQTPEATIVRFHKESGGLVTVVWANTGVRANVTLEAAAPAGLFANSEGAVWPADPDGEGNYLLRLDPATNRDLARNDTFFFGGPPIFLVEDDQQPPVVIVDRLPGISEDETLAVSWSGDDGPLGTGVLSYDVQVSTDGGPWMTWLEGATQTEAEYDTSGVSSLAFRVRAHDRAGNVSEYVENPSGPTFVSGVLMAHVLNLRGEGVEGADVSLSDGRTFTSGPDGVVRVSGLTEGTTTFRYVDGGNQGIFYPPPVTLSLGEEASATWVLIPTRNLVPNGSFDASLTGWTYVPTVEMDAIADTDGDELFLQLAGQRRAWGPPSASVSINVPRRLNDVILAFRYRVPTDSQHLVLTTITRGLRGEPDVLSRVWQSEGATGAWQWVWMDATPYVGREVELVFALDGPKDAASGLAYVDDVTLGSVPPQ